MAFVSISRPFWRESRTGSTKLAVSSMPAARIPSSEAKVRVNGPASQASTEAGRRRCRLRPASEGCIRSRDGPWPSLLLADRLSVEVLEGSFMPLAALQFLLAPGSVDRSKPPITDRLRQIAPKVRGEIRHGYADAISIGCQVVKPLSCRKIESEASGVTNRKSDFA